MDWLLNLTLGTEKFLEQVDIIGTCCICKTELTMSTPAPIEIVFNAPKELLIQDSLVLEDVKRKLLERGVEISFENKEQIDGTQGPDILSSIVATPAFEVLSEVLAVCVVLHHANVLGENALAKFRVWAEKRQQTKNPVEPERFVIDLEFKAGLNKD